MYTVAKTSRTSSVWFLLSPELVLKSSDEQLELVPDGAVTVPTSEAVIKTVLHFC